MCWVYQAFAWAIFVIFVVLGVCEQSPCFCGQNANFSFSLFLSCFRQSPQFQGRIFPEWVLVVKEFPQKLLDFLMDFFLGFLACQGAKGGAWIGGVWNGQISGPEKSISAPELSRKIPCYSD